MHIAGSCHCRNITFALDWTPEPVEIPARACSCTFCVKHGGVRTSCATGSLDVAVANPAQLRRYTFGTRTAEFHVCAACGAVPFVTARIDGQLFAVVNVNTFDGVDPSLLKRVTAVFDGEDAAARLARRKRGWIPDVTIAEGSVAA